MIPGVVSSSPTSLAGILSGGTQSFNEVPFLRMSGSGRLAVLAGPQTKTNLPAGLESRAQTSMDWPHRQASAQLLLDTNTSPSASHEAPLLDTHDFVVPGVPSMLNVNIADEMDVPQPIHSPDIAGQEAVAGAKGKGTGAKRAAHGPQEAEEEDQGLRAPCRRDAVGPKQLYQWSATVGVLLVVQVVFGCMQHGFRSLPPAADWCAGLSLLYPLASALAAHSVPKARPFAAYLLGIGSVLMTCQVAWHWHALVAQFQRDLLLHHPTTPPFHIVDAFPASSVLQRVFGSSAFDFLDTATFLIVTLQNCLQSSFVSPVGVKTTATVSGVQSVILILWPLTSPGMHEAWACRVAVSVVWTAYLVYASHVAESTRKRESQLQDDLCAAVQALRDGRRADSMLNHILKNNMADATGCIELFRREHPGAGGKLSTACDILFRGISWCKLREAMLSIVAARYEAKRCAVKIQQFARDFVRGRDVALECPSVVVDLDVTACNIILDNAATNAKRHGCPEDPQVKLRIDFPPTPSASSSFPSDMDRSAEPTQVRFLVTNAANAARPALDTQWSSTEPHAPLPGDDTRPALSDGLGLRDIRTVAKACGMEATLWQDKATVFFELLVNTTARSAALRDGSTVVSLPPDRALPPGLHILSLDDSALAQKSLKCVLEAELPDAAIATYGKGIDEVDAFMRDALVRGDIIIVDQHVDFPGHRLRGTSIVAELMAQGYAGFACIRSGDAEEADVAKSKASGAHWHVGKEVPIRTMLQELGREYHRFLQRSSLEEGPFAPDTGPQAVASSSSMPADGSGAGSSSSPSQARRSKSPGA